MSDLNLRFKIRVEVGDNEIQTCIYEYGRRKDFCREGPIVNFPWVAKKIFARGTQVGKFHFNYS